MKNSQRKRPNRLHHLCRNLNKAAVFISARILAIMNQRMATRLLVAYFSTQGMRFSGRPNYIAVTAWIDGSDYSLVEMGAGCTISGHVRILTHDWALHTAVRGLGIEPDHVLGHLRSVRIGRFSFIGMGSIIMPGADVGDGCIVGAGSVVRGKFLAGSVIAGNPAKVIMGRDEYLTRNLTRLGESEILAHVQQKLADSRPTAQEAMES